MVGRLRLQNRKLVLNYLFQEYFRWWLTAWGGGLVNKAETQDLRSGVN
jgi:hypothetical protein